MAPDLTVQSDPTYIVHMKAIQAVFDERLLAQLDATEEVRQSGRSAVLRRLVEEFLRDRRRKAIDAAYEKAYGENPGLGEEFAGWPGKTAWPDE